MWLPRRLRSVSGLGSSDVSDLEEFPSETSGPVIPPRPVGWWERLSDLMLEALINGFKWLERKGL